MLLYGMKGSVHFEVETLEFSIRKAPKSKNGSCGSNGAKHAKVVRFLLKLEKWQHSSCSAKTPLVALTTAVAAFIATDPNAQL